MDIKAEIEKVVGKVKDDPKTLEKFQSDPTKTVEGIIGVDLPDDAINGVVDGVKAKLAAGKAADAIGGITKMFGK